MLVEKCLPWHNVVTRDWAWLLWWTWNLVRCWYRSQQYSEWLWWTETCHPEPARMSVDSFPGIYVAFLVTDSWNSFVASMDTESRNLIMSLANNYDNIPNEVLAIFKTNAMTTSPSEAGLFPWVCRANHSCHPNCNYYHNTDLGLQQLFVTKHIKVNGNCQINC